MSEILNKSSRFKRRCIGCNKPFERAALIKITADKVAGSESINKLILDERMNIPGRSVYLYPSSECLYKVIRNKAKKRLFNKLFSDDCQFKSEELDTFLFQLQSKLSNSPCLEQEGGVSYAK